MTWPGGTGTDEFLVTGRATVTITNFDPRFEGIPQPTFRDSADSSALEVVYEGNVVISLSGLSTADDISLDLRPVFGTIY